MWLHAEYEAVSLFSLRLSEATATGAKTLLLPSPFAIRTALLDVALRLEGERTGPVAFERLKRLQLALRPPERIAVTNLFAKVRKPRRSDNGEEEEEIDTQEAMQPTIAFREYAHLQGTLGLALEGEEEVFTWLEHLLPHVTYFGKRASFFQLEDLPRRLEVLPPGFLMLGSEAVWGTQISGSPPGSFPLGILQMLDDWGPSLTWDKVNIYSGAKIALGPGKDRVRKGIVLPYRLARSSRSFSYYERVA